MTPPTPTVHAQHRWATFQRPSPTLLGHVPTFQRPNGSHGHNHPLRRRPAGFAIGTGSGRIATEAPGGGDGVRAEGWRSKNDEATARIETKAAQPALAYPSDCGGLMAETATELDEIVDRLQEIFERRRVRRAILFGSFCRGEPSRRSDIDLLVVQDTKKRWLDRYEGILREVGEAVSGRDVDLLIYTPQELEEVSQRPLIARALREGKLIYESDEESTSS